MKTVMAAATQPKPPLEGVRFRVDDTLNGIQDVGGTTISDWNGEAGVEVWLPGCPDARFKVSVEVTTRLSSQN